MAVFTRAVRGWPLSRHLDQTLPWTALRRALVRHRPDLHPADQGGQYAATASVQTWRTLGVQIRMATVGAATEHGDAERLMRTSNAEEIALHDDTACHAAYQRLHPFLDDVYQHQRMPSAWGYLTPAECETHGRQQDPMAESRT